jgi:putative mRNA 3-end processing factor
VNCPIVASPRLCNTADVYRRHGYTIDELINAECPEGLELSQTQRVIQVYSTGDGEPYVKQNGTTIVLSAFASHNTKPVTEFSEKSFSVALSNHADFEGTLAYIEATGAAFVVTDNTRHGKGVELAEAIKRRLNVDARPSTHYVSKEWGR